MLVRFCSKSLKLVILYNFDQILVKFLKNSLVCLKVNYLCNMYCNYINLGDYLSFSYYVNDDTSLFSCIALFQRVPIWIKALRPCLPFGKNLFLTPLLQEQRSQNLLRFTMFCLVILVIMFTDDLWQFATSGSNKFFF